MTDKPKMEKETSKELNRHAEDIKEICHNTVRKLEGDDYSLGTVGLLKQAFKVLDNSPVTTKMDNEHWQKLLDMTHDLREHIYKYTSFISMIQIRYTSENANIKNLDKVIEKANLEITRYTGLPVDNKKNGD
tara:strand:- start:210 stop:605 length:396 start_codon:yes stop_codon:yes gene_type:complete